VREGKREEKQIPSSLFPLPLLMAAAIGSDNSLWVVSGNINGDDQLL
jgi:hypothetical protein